MSFPQVHTGDFVNDGTFRIMLIIAVEDVQDKAEEMGIELTDEEALEILTNMKSDSIVENSWYTIEAAIDYR